jgi:hypothetical protein
MSPYNKIKKGDGKIHPLFYVDKIILSAFQYHGHALSAADAK